jgi:hypothetical protein
MGPEGPVGAGHTLIRKTASESVTNNATPQNDDHLVLAIAGNEVWEFEAFILCTSTSNAPDIKFTFTAPAGATISWLSSYNESTNLTNNALISASGTTANNAITGGSTGVIRVRGVVVNGATAGNLQFQWSQNSSNGTATQVLTNSFMKAGKF